MLRIWIARLLYGGGALVAAAALGWRYRVAYEAARAPLQPVVETGHLIVWAHQGAAHYITAEQAQALSLSLEAVLVGVLAVAAGVLLQWGPNAFRRK